MPDTPEAVPMSREELQEAVASTICCHTRMSPAVQWEVDLLMGAIDKHVALVLERADAAIARVRELHEEGFALCTHCKQPWPCPTIQALNATTEGMDSASYPTEGEK